MKKDSIFFCFLILLCSELHLFPQDLTKVMTETWLMADSSLDTVQAMMLFVPRCQQRWAGVGEGVHSSGEGSSSCCVCTPSTMVAAPGTAISIQLIFLTASMRSKLQSSPKLLLDRLYTPKWHDPALLQQQHISAWRPAAASLLCVYTHQLADVVFSACQLMKMGFS